MAATGGPPGRVEFDNDRLAALVMSHIEADLLVLLTDVDGLMQLGLSGSKEAGAKIISLVEEITPELKALAFCTAIITRLTSLLGGSTRLSK